MPAGPLATNLRGQAEFCAGHGSPLYGLLCDALADDIESGTGPGVALLQRWSSPGTALERVNRDAPALRLLGGVHRLVLTGRAPTLAPYFPTAGGTAAPEGAVRPFRDLLTSPAGQELAPALDHPPQTNEVGRAGPLMGGLRHVSAGSGGRPIRLYEIGASAGLLLRAEHLPVGPGQVIDTELPLPAAPPVVVVERVGGDPSPVDAATDEGRLLLTSYVWPDDSVRQDRLRAALDVAPRVPVELRRVDAASLVDSLALVEGTTTVLWHSVMWQYVGDEERSRVSARLDELGAAATPEAGFAHLSFEPSVDAFKVRLTVWPGGEERMLGAAPPHGVPVTWA